MENTVMTRIPTFFWYCSIFFSVLKTFLLRSWSSHQFEPHQTPQSHAHTVGMLKRFNLGTQQQWYLTRHYLTEECNRIVTHVKESKFHFLKIGETIFSHI